MTLTENARTGVAEPAREPASRLDAVAGVWAVEWLARMAARLDLARPAPEILHAVVEALPWRADDPRYGGNVVASEGPPFEVSFDEATPGALRFDFAHCDPAWSMERRREWAATTVLRWATTAFAPRVRSGIERSLARLCALPLPPQPRFGAFVGAAWDGRGLAASKIYGELAGLPDGMTPGIEAVAEAASRIPGVAPLFWSAAYDRQQVVPRLYFLFDDEIPVMDLHALLAAARLTHRLPELVSLATALTGNGWILPARSTVFSVRDCGGALDCKLEFLTSAVRLSPASLRAGVSGLLRERPATRAAVSRWASSLGDDQVPHRLNVVGGRVSASHGVRLGLYAGPASWSG